MPLHTGRLLLAPVDPQQAPAREPLRAALTHAGLFGVALAVDGDKMAGEVGGYVPGERFFEYVAFTGCAVRLDDPPATVNPSGCHLRLEPPSAVPRFFSGRNSRPPRCPACARTLSDWRSAMEYWSWPARIDLTCPACNESAPAWNWDWRGHAGFARLTLTIEEVFPGEVGILPGLSRLLEQASDGLSWHWFVIQD